MKGKMYLLLAVMLVSMMFLFAVSSEAADKTPIRIGVLNPLSGIYADSGIAINNAIKLYFDKINYKIAGREVELLFEDTEMKPEVGLIKAKRLVESKNVHILTGIVSSGVALAVRDYVITQKVPLLISGAGGADEITKHLATPYVFRSSLISFRDGAVPADYAYKHLGYRKVGVLALDYQAGYEYAAAFAVVFRKLGGEITQELYCPMNTADFSPYLTRLNLTANALFTFAPGAAGLRFVKQYAEQGFKPKLPHICSFTTEEEVLQEQGDDALGVIRGCSWSPALNTSNNNEFIESYYKKYGQAPTTVGTSGYVGAMIIAEAVNAVKGNVEDREAFVRALKAVKLRDTPQGRVEFDDRNMAVYDYHIGQTVKVEGKRWKYENKIIYTYKMVNQFWPFTPEEGMKRPPLADLKGKLVGKGPL